MAMLAEPRRKQKWTLNPRGKHWSDDSNKFGQKMLEKMGWSSGKGLGANLDGMTEHIRCKYKNDQAGIGFSHDDRDKQWTQHQEGFNELLQKLQDGEAAETPAAEKELSGKSLELKSKQSRARVHYQKFTRGKDVNKYSTKDLANIFGKKDLDDKLQEVEIKVEIKEEPEEPSPEPIGSSDNSHGVVTIKGGSINDYFKNKMFALGRKLTTEITNDSESECETHTGFGFSTAQIKTVTPSKSMGTHLSFVKSESDISSSNEAKHTPRKRKNGFVFENPALDVDSPAESNETPRKRKSDFVFDNPALELADSTTEMEHTPKRRRSDFAFENNGFDVEHQLNGESVSASSFSEEITKKKRKKKVKEPVMDGFINEALNLESRDDEISSSSQFEIPRACFGLANNALDLTDETNGRKRVTFNETVEFDTDVTSGKRKKKKNKNGGKLDKFEVDNEKMKRKKKKERRDEVAESAFVNEAMDVDVESQEANDNAVNERKSERARRKRDRRMSNLETIAEAPDEEKESVIEVVTLDESLVGETSEDFEVLSLETPKKKKKKRKNREDENFSENQQNEIRSTTFDINNEDFELVEEISTIDLENSAKKSKKSRHPKDEGDAVKGDKRNKKASVTVEPEEMDLTEDKVETVKKIKKEKIKKEDSSEDSTENTVVSNMEISNFDLENSAKKSKKSKVPKEEGNAVKRNEKRKKVSVVREPEEMDLTDYKEETVKKIKKEKTEKEDLSEDSKENISVENVFIKMENVDQMEISSFDLKNSSKKSKKSREPEEEENAEKENKKKKKASVAREPEEMDLTEYKVETVKKIKKEKMEKETSSDDSKENMDTENVAVKMENVEQMESAKKKKKQKKIKKEREEENGIEQTIEESEKTPVEEKHFHSDAQSSWDLKLKQSKKSFKALFARTPIVNFVGSNINEIKGYGVDF